MERTVLDETKYTIRSHLPLRVVAIKTQKHSMLVVITKYVSNGFVPAVVTFCCILTPKNKSNCGVLFAGLLSALSLTPDRPTAIFSYKNHGNDLHKRILILSLFVMSLPFKKNGALACNMVVKNTGRGRVNQNQL